MLKDLRAQEDHKEELGLPEVREPLVGQEIQEEPVLQVKLALVVDPVDKVFKGQVAIPVFKVIKVFKVIRDLQEHLEELFYLRALLLWLQYMQVEVVIVQLELYMLPDILLLVTQIKD